MITSGEHTVVITGPAGEWTWTGHAENRTDALACAQTALDGELADVKLLPGERLAANGVIIGSGAALDIPRFGADFNDFDYPAEA